MYKIPQTSINQKVGDELVILDMNSGKYFGLDEVGARMVELLKTHGDPEKVAQIMVDEYDAPYQTIKNDLDALIEELLNSHLIEKIESV